MAGAPTAAGRLTAAGARPGVTARRPDRPAARRRRSPRRRWCCCSVAPRPRWSRASGWPRKRPIRSR